jgi:hypothetical protein
MISKTPKNYTKVRAVLFFTDLQKLFDTFQLAVEAPVDR